MSFSEPVSHSLSLPASLTLRSANEVKGLILTSLASNPATDLDIPEEAEVDLSFVQMIEAARLQADACETQLSLSRQADGALLAVLHRSGLIEDMSETDKKFWLHQGETQ